MRRLVYATITFGVIVMLSMCLATGKGMCASDLTSEEMITVQGGTTYHCQTDWQCEYTPNPGDPGY